MGGWGMVQQNTALFEYLIFFVHSHNLHFSMKPPFSNILRLGKKGHRTDQSGQRVNRWCSFLSSLVSFNHPEHRNLSRQASVAKNDDEVQCTGVLSTPLRGM